MRYRDWTQPRVGDRRSDLLDGLLADIGATEVASIVEGVDGDAFRVVAACDLGLLVMDYAKNETPVAPSLSGGLTRWQDVGGIGLAVEFQWLDGKKMSPTIRLTIARPGIAVEAVRDHDWPSTVSDARAVGHGVRLGRVPPQ